jgi:hypothetical protein
MEFTQKDKFMRHSLIRRSLRIHILSAELLPQKRVPQTSKSHGVGTLEIK